MAKWISSGNYDASVGGEALAAMLEVFGISLLDAEIETLIQKQEARANRDFATA